MNSWLIQGSKNLIRRRYHLLPTLLAVSIGMMLVTIVGGIGEIGFAMVEEEISGLGVGSVTITANKTIADVPLTEEKLTVLREAPGVESASPVVMLFTPVRLKGEVTQSAVWGTDMGSDQVVELSLLYGRLLVEADITERRPVCVIDENLAQEIYGRSNIVGKEIEVMLSGQYQPFTIVGVAASGGAVVQGVLSSGAPGFVYLPYPILQQASGKSGYDQIAVTLTDPAQSEEEGERLAEELAERFGEQPGSYTVEDMASQKEQLEGIAWIVKVSLVSISGISLVVSCLGVMTVMSGSVTERIREIGIKKAVGAKNRDILMEFLGEGLILSLIGAVLGLVLGIIALWGACRIVGAVPRWDPMLLAAGVLMTVLLGTVCSAGPALRAARMDPVRALASE